MGVHDRKYKYWPDGGTNTDEGEVKKVRDKNKRVT